MNAAKASSSIDEFIVFQLVKSSGLAGAEAGRGTNHVSWAEEICTAKSAPAASSMRKKFFMEMN